MRRTLILSLALTLTMVFSALAGGKVNSFWSDCSSEFKKENWRVYRPHNQDLAKHGFLVVTTVDQPFEGLRPQHVLGELYGQIDNLALMGQKETMVAGQTGLVLSFRGSLKDQDLVGRAAFSADGDKTKLIMLVRHSEASDKLLEAFEQLVRDGTDNLPDAP